MTGNISKILGGVCGICQLLKLIIARVRGYPLIAYNISRSLVHNVTRDIYTLSYISRSINI